MERARKVNKNGEKLQKLDEVFVPDSFVSKFSNEDNYTSWLLLDFTRFVVARLRDYELSKIQITPEQAAILQILNRRNGKATISEISSAWMRRLHSVSTLVRRMEKQGLVKVIKHPGVKVLDIEISEKGKKYYKKLNRVPIDAVYSVLSQSDIKQLSSYLRLLLERARNLLKTID